MRRALVDPNLLGRVLSGESWKPWRTLLIAAMGEELYEDEQDLFQQLTGRDTPPLQPVEEFVGVVGRRGGKSRAIATIATYLAGLVDHPALVAGERGVLLIIASDQRQADIVLGYIQAAFEQSAILSQLIEGRIQRTLRLTNRIDIEVRAADFRRLRGPTYIAVIGDEAAFWHNAETSSNPDSEILNAVRPGLATTGGPLLLISSPYARRGELWNTYSKHYGPKGDPLVLVAQGASRLFNQTLPQSVVDRALERDRPAASAEYLAEFRRDLEAFVSIEAVNSCLMPGRYELSPDRSIIYQAFADPSGGSSDSMTLAIAHKARGRDYVLIDAIREITPPFSPEQTTKQFAALLQSYGITKVVGDRYAGEWPREAFARHSIAYELSAKPKSELYLDLLATINSTRVGLLDQPKLVNQLTSLERRTSRSGKDSIDHPPNQHDDIANAVAGVSSIILNQPGIDYASWFSHDPADPDGNAAWRSQQLYNHILEETSGLGGGRVITWR